MIKPSVLFLMSFIVVYMQLPLESIVNAEWFRSVAEIYLFNKRNYLLCVTYASFCGIGINLGYTIQNNRINKTWDRKELISLRQRHSIYDNIPDWFFPLLSLVLFIAYILIMPWDYFGGGYSYFMNEASVEIVNGTRIQGYLLRVIILIDVLIIWKAKRQRIGISNFRTFLRKYPKVALWVQILFSLLVLMSGDRGPVFFIGIPFLVTYFSISQKKMKLPIFILLVVGAGVFFTVFKLTGGLVLDRSYRDVFSGAFERFSSGYKRDSISPYTIELAGSFFAYSVAWDAWLSGTFTKMLNLLMSSLMSIPFAVTLVLKLSGLLPSDYSPAVIVTEHAQIYGYGIGTDVIGSMMLDMTPVITPLVFIGIGSLIRTLDRVVYSPNCKFQWLLLALIFSSDAFYIPRASIYVVIGGFVFSVLLCYMVAFLFRKRGLHP